MVLEAIIMILQNQSTCAMHLSLHLTVGICLCHRCSQGHGSASRNTASSRVSHEINVPLDPRVI